MDSLELIGTQSIHFIDEKIEFFRSFFFQSLISVQIERVVEVGADQVGGAEDLM